MLELEDKDWLAFYGKLIFLINDGHCPGRVTLCANSHQLLPFDIRAPLWDGGWCAPVSDSVPLSCSWRRSVKVVAQHLTSSEGCLLKTGLTNPQWRKQCRQLQVTDHRVRTYQVDFSVTVKISSSRTTFFSSLTLLITETLLRSNIWRSCQKKRNIKRTNCILRPCLLPNFFFNLGFITCHENRIPFSWMWKYK